MGSGRVAEGYMGGGARQSVVRSLTLCCYFLLKILDFQTKSFVKYIILLQKYRPWEKMEE